jgi:outer membrane biosynthesis protein TonB
MKQLASALSALPATAAAAVLALSVGLCAGAPANAETAEPAPTCGLICLPGLSEPDPKDPRTPHPKPTPEGPSVPPAPAPAPPLPAETGPAAVSTVDPEPSESSLEETPTEVTSTAPGATSSTASPSTESNWNKPVTKSTQPTQAAAVSGSDGPGFGDPGLLTVLVGVLLMGLGGLAFAWWGRNRASAH